MTEPLCCIAVVPAAGVGRRMGSQIPKQYLQVAGKTILEHSVTALLAAPRVKHVVIALHPQDPYFARLALAADPRVSRVDGGDSRSESVVQALRFAVKHFPQSIALVHDAARPCLSLSSLNRLIDAVQEQPEQGALLAVRVRDTMKRAHGGQVTATVERENLWHAQTPQAATGQRLLEALEMARQNNLAVTDESSALEYAGCTPRLIEGSLRNFKVTEPDDLVQAEFWLSQS